MEHRRVITTNEYTTITNTNLVSFGQGTPSSSSYIPSTGRLNLGESFMRGNVHFFGGVKASGLLVRCFSAFGGVPTQKSGIKAFVRCPFRVWHPSTHKQRRERGRRSSITRFHHFYYRYILWERQSTGNSQLRLLHERVFL